jgi:hypothetical protein
MGAGGTSCDCGGDVIDSSAAPSAGGHITKGDQGSFEGGNISSCFCSWAQVKKEISF